MKPLFPFVGNAWKEKKGTKSKRLASQNKKELAATYHSKHEPPFALASSTEKITQLMPQPPEETSNTTITKNVYPAEDDINEEKKSNDAFPSVVVNAKNQSIEVTPNTRLSDASEKKRTTEKTIQSCISNLSYAPTVPGYPLEHKKPSIEELLDIIKEQQDRLSQQEAKLKSQQDQIGTLSDPNEDLNYESLRKVEHSSCPFHSSLYKNVPQNNSEDVKKQKHEVEYLATGEKKNLLLSETIDQNMPRHEVGCTPHECHGALMEKKGFGRVANADSLSQQTRIEEATKFLRQYAEETGYFGNEEKMNERLKKVTSDIMCDGTYVHTPEELEFGCRLAWRNSGRCIMRKVSFSLELRDCRHITTAYDCFRECMDHLRYATNGGAVKPVISVFSQKPDGMSAHIRIWNRQLIGYAAYRRLDGSIMGDPANLGFTALCVKFGWVSPEDKSDFDVLPLLISDVDSGHENPKIFELPSDAVAEVQLEHPEFDLFSELNLRWYVLPAISNMGVDIGGVYYQTCPFNGWYAITEIARDFLDKQRYNLAEAVAIACDIPMTTLNVWQDDVQLQFHRAILHSFAKKSMSVVDHHTASEAFLDFHAEEVKKRGKCPADWVWLVPPAGGSMTGVFHQEMFNFIVKPQYRTQVDPWEEERIEVPCPIDTELIRSRSSFLFDKQACLFKKIYGKYIVALLESSLKLLKHICY